MSEAERTIARADAMLIDLANRRQDRLDAEAATEAPPDWSLLKPQES